jgi:hypothetical protein
MGGCCSRADGWLWPRSVGEHHPYPAECVEGVFREIRPNGVLGSTHMGAPESVSKNLQRPIRNAARNARETIVL